MKRFAVSFLLFLFAGFNIFGAGKPDGRDLSAQKEITVFIAASTTDVISDLAEMFTKETGIIVKINPASSGTLAKQIEQGAAPDVYISASKKWMDYVSDLGVVSVKSPFVKNRIVLIAPVDTKLKPFTISSETDLPSLFSTRLSMGDPDHVPAGKYAQESLKYYGWFDAIEARILPAKDVRAALSVVELGETDLGIVYETDAMLSSKVVILSRFPEESHSPIDYYCAFLNEGSEAGKLFYDFLFSKEAVSVYKKYGFTPSK